MHKVIAAMEPDPVDPSDDFSTVISQAAVAARVNPKNIRNRIIQAPGRGRQVIIDGNTVKIKNGNARPNPKAKKIKKISSGPRARANPTAVPKNGAEHGVARRVTSAPCKKWLERWLLFWL